MPKLRFTVLEFIHDNQPFVRILLTDIVIATIPIKNVIIILELWTFSFAESSVQSKIIFILNNQPVINKALLFLKMPLQI